MDSYTSNEIVEVPETENSEIIEDGVTDEIREVPKTGKSEIEEEGEMKVKVTNKREEVQMTERLELQKDGSLRVVTVSTPAAPKNVLGKSPGNLSSKDMIFRADQIDLKSLDIQLERHMTRAWSRTVDPKKPKEVWEIDLSKLQIKYLVARGTYGTIYRGTYDNLDVAVKVLDWGEDGVATTTETTTLRASFQQEVAVWHQLEHPNVTKFIGASMGTSDLKIPENASSSSDALSNLPARACCVVVEYVPGGTLKSLLFKNRKKKLPFKVVVQLALDLARGLSYLHSKKIVHRDVKAENMLLDYRRNLKIADFGVARVEAQNPKDMTGETGTLGYMAPEVLDGKPYNRKCDVYSFGVCLWEIYCCDLPYVNLSFAEVSSAVVRQNLRPDIPRCCPSSFASIMKKCWDVNPQKRPEMEEVVRLLEAIDTSKGGGMIPEDQASGCFCFAPMRGP
ncbi:serine/threonine-protein kinase 52-like [Apium graveolens]|uniref:serine/threonine-protein kinase 52-like n=1 Tax=Apium graveolens TaxID=4045 RepID=UPI003D79EC14